MESNTLTPADPTRPADVELDVQSSAEASRSTDETISANANRHAEEPRQAILLLPVEAIKTTSDLNSSIVPGESLPVEPNPKLRLSIPEALQKLETIMNAIHPRRKRGPKICHAIRISRQIFKDLGTHVRDVGALWTAMGRRQKFSNIAGRQVWLPSPAELENVKEGAYPYMELFGEQFWETNFCPRYRRCPSPDLWTAPVEEAFHRGWHIPINTSV